VGDWIQLENGRQGRVREIRWRHTVVETRDWDTVIVPNQLLLTSQITILGKRDGQPLQHRMWVDFHVDYRVPPSRVIQVVGDALRASPFAHVALDPPPDVICVDFTRDGGVYATYAVRYWLTDLSVDDPTSSSVRTRIYAALRRADVAMSWYSSTLFVAPFAATESAPDQASRRARAIRDLDAIDLFKPLLPEEREPLAEHLIRLGFVAGETITRQGAVAHWLYVLSSGEVEVRTAVDGAAEKVVATLRSPAFFGEMGLMTGEPRLASVVATTDVECYRIDKAGFQAVVHGRPEVAKELSRVLAARRVELVSVRDGLDAEARYAREKNEQERILERIQVFFGLQR
jgi:CRP-like cAMP-binding protein